MGYRTAAAVLYAIIQIEEIPSTLSSHGIEWAVTEQTVKVIFFLRMMAREVFAVSVAEELILFSIFAEILVPETVQTIAFITFPHINPDIFCTPALRRRDQPPAGATCPPAL